MIKINKPNWGKGKVQQKNTVAEPTTQATPNASADYDTWQKLVIQDDRHLKTKPEHKDRDKAKPALLDNYRDYLTKWMTAGETHENTVLGFNVVWSADVAQWDWMFKLADYSADTNQQFDAFKRNPITIASDVVLNQADTIYKAGFELFTKGHNEKATLLWNTFEDVFNRIHSKQWDVHQFTKARYYRLKGLFEQTQESWQSAFDYLVKAYQLKSDIGVKGNIRTVAKHLNISADEVEKIFD